MENNLSAKNRLAGEMHAAISNAMGGAVGGARPRVRQRSRRMGRVEGANRGCFHDNPELMDGERVALEEVVDIDAQTQRNNAAMRRVIDFVMDGGANE